ncbi:hypothetical protein ACOMHN_033236 [Nucella lapillus]
MEDIEEDPRFAHTARDPRFKPNFKQKKVKIDSRFKSMLQDKEFQVKFIDKRGRPINSSTKEDLKRLYQYESDEEKESGEEKSEEEESREESSSQKEEEASEEELDGEQPEADGEQAEADDDDFPDLTEEGGPDYARGIGILESSSDDDDEEEEAGEAEEEEEDEPGALDHKWNEPDHNAPEAEEITSRLALCNMDWDRIKARDLYVLFSSFIPQGGAVQSVSIYPSELGRQKMAEEEKLGPREFREGEEKKTRKGHMGKLDRAKLRRYQLNRLAYYYAVIVCDSKDTANKLYEECDSMEYEKSSCRIDLRFIPENMTFEETPKESCNGVSDLSTFEPSTFTTTAFCQAKVQVTWDETNIERLNRTMQKKFTEEDLDSVKYDELLASSASCSSSEDSDEEGIWPGAKKEKKGKKKEKKKEKTALKDVEKYRKLLGLEDDKSGGKKGGGKKMKSPALLGEGESEEEEEDGFFLPSDSGESEEEIDEEMQFPSSEESEDEGNEQELNTVSTKAKEKEKKKKKKEKKTVVKEKEKEKKKTATKEKEKKKKKSVMKENDEKEDSSEEEQEGDMEYTWQPGANKNMLRTHAKNKMSPWEEYQQKKKDKKKQKKHGRKIQRLKERGVEDTTDLGFDDEFFNEDPSTDQKKQKKDKKKKKRQEEEREETEAEKKERAALALLIRNEEELRRKGKKRKQSEAEDMDSFKMKMDDRFGSVYTDPEMRIDPNAPEFKKRKSSQL